jgi:hypothetical protein
MDYNYALKHGRFVRLGKRVTKLRGASQTHTTKHGVNPPEDDDQSKDVSSDFEHQLPCIFTRELQYERLAQAVLSNLSSTSSLAFESKSSSEADYVRGVI